MGYLVFVLLFSNNDRLYSRSWCCWTTCALDIESRQEVEGKRIDRFQGIDTRKTVAISFPINLVYER